MMRKIIFSIALLLIQVSLFSAESTVFSYPDLSIQPERELINRNEISLSAVEEFLVQWKHDKDTEPSSVIAESATIQQLESVYRIQLAQTDQLRREARPRLSLVSDPANPVYGYTRMYQSTGAPPTEVFIEAHQFGLGATLSQQLPTAGSVDLTVKHAVSATNTVWAQQPVLSLSVQQPLGAGEYLLDPSYGKKLLEKQLLGQEQARATVDQTRKELTVQILNQYYARQALKESRWLLIQQLVLQDETVTRAELDFASGIISRNQLVQQQLARENLLAQIHQFDREIASLDTALDKLTGGKSVIEPSVEELMQSLDEIASYAHGRFPQDLATIEQALSSDADYMRAVRDLEIARIDKRLGTVADAPRLSVAMQVNPHYSATATTFTDSFGELFGANQSELSVSVSFIASDLGRSVSKTVSSLADEAMLQATIAQGTARDAVLDQFDAYQQEIDLQLLNLSLDLEAYTVAVHDLEISSIRAEAGIIDNFTLRRAELQVYEEAFAMLQQVRNMYLLQLEISQFLSTSF
jgi:outer membrane protein TolC